MCAGQKILNNALKEVLLVRRIEAGICFCIFIEAARTLLR